MSDEPCECCGDGGHRMAALYGEKQALAAQLAQARAEVERLQAVLSRIDNTTWFGSRGPTDWGCRTCQRVFNIISQAADIATKQNGGTETK